MGSRPPYLLSIFFYLCSFGFLAIAFISEILSNISDTVNKTKPYVVRSIYKKNNSNKK